MNPPAEYTPLPITEQELALLYSPDCPAALRRELMEKLGTTSAGREELELIQFMESLDSPQLAQAELPEATMDACWDAIQDRIEQEQTLRKFHRSRWREQLEHVRELWSTVLDVVPDVFRVYGPDSRKSISDPDPRLLERRYPMTDEQHRALEKIMLDLGYFRDWERRRQVIVYVRSGLAAACLLVLFLGAVAGMRIHQQNQQERLGRWQQELNTIAQVGGVFELDGVGQISLPPGAELELVKPRTVALKSGQAWFDIERRGKGFAVMTGQGEVHVTGTSFGVRNEQEQSRLDVIEGTVELEHRGKRLPVRAGEMAFMQASGVQIETDGDWGMSRPYWVQALQQPNYTAPQGVIPYTADSATAFLQQCEAPVGNASPSIECTVKTYSQIYFVPDASPNQIVTRTYATEGMPDQSPFQGMESVPGLGQAASVLDEAHLAGAFIPQEGQRRFNPRTDLMDLKHEGNVRRLYRASGDQGVKFNDQLFNTENFTIEAWIRNEEGYFPGQEPVIFHVRDRYRSRQEPNYLVFGLTTAREGAHELFLAYSTGPTEFASFASGEPVRFEAGKWYHVAVTFEPGPAGHHVRFYVDSEDQKGSAHRRGTLSGKEVFNAPKPAQFNGGTDGMLEVGAAFHFGLNSLNGAIDEVRYSNVTRKQFNLPIEPVLAAQGISPTE